MRKIRNTVQLLLLFILSVILAFYFEEHYRVLVRFFFKFYQGDKISFFGKNFYLLASPYMLISFGLFSVVLTGFLYRQSVGKVLIYLLSAIGLFFISTMTTAYFDSLSKVINCTTCQDGVKRVHYNNVNYAFHFIVSLLAGLIPVFWSLVKIKLSNSGRHTKP